ncbi:MAG: hypothetical protein GVY25_11260 [Bacteroidetes bacterium]|jgi:predicted solute-binding protein|nr:hypothetical protein [Bacteroidota bacterium]
MKLAIWDLPPAEFLVSGFTSGAVSNPFDILRYRPEECARRLVQGEVDIALLPTTLALQAADSIDVVPSIGLVSWKYPYARLAWSGGLRDYPETIAYDRRVSQERFIARVVMQEHYGAEPAFVPYDGRTPRQLLETEEDAALLVGNDVPAMQLDAFSMDIGREWYELTNYPMVWGLFVMQRDRANDEVTEALVDAREAAEENRDVWVMAQETSERLGEFYREDLRSALDRLALASLTELRQYMFYYDLTDEVPDLPFVFLGQGDDDDDDGPGSPPPEAPPSSGNQPPTAGPDFPKGDLPDIGLGDDG